MVVGDKLSACLMLVPDDCLSEPEIKALNWVDGSWWDVETVPAGVKCHFEEGSTLVVPVNEKQKQGTNPNQGI